MSVSNHGHSGPGDGGILTDYVATVAALSGGATITQKRLKEWVESGAYEMLTVTYDGTYTHVVSSATLKWPDASTGVFNTLSINGTWQAIDAYYVTHVDSGYVVTQTLVTRNASGQITAKLPLTALSAIILSDAVDITESATVTLSGPQISVSDGVAVAESVYLVFISIPASESVTVTDTPTVSIV